MQATSTAIRQERLRQKVEDGSTSFTARQAQVAALAEIILRDGQPELHADSTALCSHFKLRRGLLPDGNGEMNAVEALVYRHPVGNIVRLWIYGAAFSVKVRDVIFLYTEEAKGWDTWLDTGAGDAEGGRLFPHSGKYLMPGLKILSHCLLGRQQTKKAPL